MGAKNYPKCIAWRGALNLLIVGIIFIPVLYYNFNGTPYIRGFFCNDESLRHPFLKSTIKSTYLYIVGILLPLVSIAIIESLGKGELPQGDPVVWGRVRVSSVKLNFYFIFVGYLFGTAATQCLTDITKYNVGRLRPHFFAVCNPDFQNITCGTESEPVYVRDYTCRGNPLLFQGDLEETNYRIQEARVSFVSGHSSFAFQAAVFLILYLQARGGACTKYKKRLLVVPFFQFLLLCGAIYTAISRVMDYKHHPGDVIAGGLLGTIVQVFNALFITKVFKLKTKRGSLGHWSDHSPQKPFLRAQNHVETGL